MTTTQAYQNFIIKINENATTDNLSCDKGRFVVLFNSEQNRLIESFLDRRFEDDIRYIQAILVDDYKISESTKHLDHQDFKLPENYFDFSNVYAEAVKDNCEGKIDLFEIKDENRNNILRDELTKPSFKYREAPFNIASNKIKVYTLNDFNVKDLILSYYRYPSQISLKNPENPESEFSNNDPEFDDKFVNRVIALCASQFLLNNGDARYQAKKVNAAQKL